MKCVYCKVKLGSPHFAGCRIESIIVTESHCGVNQMPPEQGKRDKIRPRHDLIPLEFLDELASIFEEGRRPRPGLPEGYGDSWKRGGSDFLRDCLNHASNHLHAYMNNDFSENQLAKVAWNVLVVRYFELKKIRGEENAERDI